MEDLPLLSKAPITEAIIDIQFPWLESCSIDSLNDISIQLGAGYVATGPLESLNLVWSFEAESEGNQGQRSEKTQFGIRCDNVERGYVVQLRFNGFTISKLPPYESWSVFQAEAKRVWGIVTKQVAISGINRIATRYINKISIPIGSEDSPKVGDYLNTAAPIPEPFSRNIINFLSRVTVQINDLPRTSAIVTQASDSPDHQKQTLPVILDIDVFHVDPVFTNEDDFWELMGKLRLYKNRIFRTSVTQKVIDLCQ